MSPLPSEQALRHRTLTPIKVNSRGYVEDRPLRQGMVDHLAANFSEVVREVRAHEKNGRPLEDRCELCGFRHGIGYACLKPRQFAPGVSVDERAAVPFIGVGSAERSRKRQQLKDRIRWAEIMATRRANGYKLNSNKKLVKLEAK